MFQIQKWLSWAPLGNVCWSFPDVRAQFSQKVYNESLYHLPHLHLLLLHVTLLNHQTCKMALLYTRTKTSWYKLTLQFYVFASIHSSKQVELLIILCCTNVLSHFLYCQFRSHQWTCHCITNHKKHYWKFVATGEFTGDFLHS